MSYTQVAITAVLLLAYLGLFAYGVYLSFKGDDLW